jgi:2-keto-3-deoxy-L-rhamnonate aldolase RhmA
MVVKKLKEGKRIVGTMVRMVRNPAIARVAAVAGLDFIMLDMEHGPFNIETVEDVFKTARAAGLGSFIRVPELAKGYVSRILDAGANGVMVPMIESVEQARQLAGWSKYAPTGVRGFGGAGGHTDFASISAEATPAFMTKANLDNLTIAQIETGPAIDCVDAIAAVPGIDALLIGPNDLAISLGCAGDLMGEALDTAIAKVAAAAKKHGKILGMHGPDALLDRWIPRGLTLVMNNLDINMLINGMKAIATKYGAK